MEANFPGNNAVSDIAKARYHTVFFNIAQILFNPEPEPKLF